MTRAMRGMWVALVCAGGFILAATGCGPDLQVSVSALEISPNPAQPGQAVAFAFRLTVIPEQGFTLIARIDGTEHSRVARFAAEDGPFTIDVGDAGDLIARYGLGDHLGAVEVRLDDGTRTATASRNFQLQEPPPPLEVRR